MPTDSLMPNRSKPQLWGARICFSIAAIFLLFDAVTKIATPAPVVDAFTTLGIPLHLAVGIGVLQMVCLVLYMIPRTAVVGGLLLVAYLGGATAIHVCAESTLFETLFPAIIATLAWAALYLRDPRLRELLPFVRPAR